MRHEVGAVIQFLASIVVMLGLSSGMATAQTDSGGALPDRWPALAGEIFNNHPLRDGSTVLAIDAPYRADDAALVPVTIRSLLPSTDTREIRRITLVIDENPSPLAAVFELGQDSGIDRISTRVRINDYTNVHAVAETNDGTLYVVQRFVKAAGGCSAPAIKQVAGDIPLGTLRFRRFQPGEGTRPGTAEAELMIRHPNNSGMQMDQLTRLYIPAHFVRSVMLWQGDHMLLTVQGGISLSENPAFRFDYRPNGAKSFRAEVIDNKDGKFSGTWPGGDAVSPAG
jgi:sulfur-oxidizing protein SoxY